MLSNHVARHVRIVARHCATHHTEQLDGSDRGGTRLATGKVWVARISRACAGDLGGGDPSDYEVGFPSHRTDYRAPRLTKLARMAPISGESLGADRQNYLVFGKVG
jgi:hypothetical protein